MLKGVGAEGWRKRGACSRREWLMQSCGGEREQRWNRECEGRVWGAERLERIPNSYLEGVTVWERQGEESPS